MRSLLDLIEKPIDPSYKNELISDAKAMAMYFGDEYIYKNQNGKYFIFEHYGLIIRYEIVDGESVVTIKSDGKTKFSSLKDTYSPGKWEESFKSVKEKLGNEYYNETLGNKLAFCGRYLISHLGETKAAFYIDQNTHIEIELYDEDDDMGRIEHQIIFSVYTDRELVFRTTNYFYTKWVDLKNLCDTSRINKRVSGEWEQKLINYVTPLLDIESKDVKNGDAYLVNNGIKRIRRVFY